MAFLKKKKVKNKTYYSLVRKVKKDNGKWGIKTIKSYARKEPKYFHPFLLKGDCVPAMQKFADETFDLVLTDPPYFLESGTGVGKWDQFENRKAFRDFTNGWLSETHRVLKKDGVLISFFCKYKISYVYDFLADKGYHPIDVLTWIKPNGNCYSHLRKMAGKTENAIIMAKGKRYTFNNEKNVAIPNLFTRSTLVASSNERSDSGYHPTEKPKELINHLMGIFAPQDCVVLDPFMGKGTTPHVAYSRMLKCVGIEMDPYYYRCSAQRIKKMVTNNPLRVSKFTPKGFIGD